MKQRKASDSGAYEITNVVRDKKGNVTYLQINHDQIYHYMDLVNIIRTGKYSLYVLKGGQQTRARLIVPKEGEPYFSTTPNKDLMDNLDYLPMAVL